VQNVLTGLNLALLGGFILAGFAAAGSGAQAITAGGEFWAAPRWSAHAGALLFVMFAYSGWNAAAYLSEEVERPERNLPRALLLGTLTVTVLYLLLNLLLFAAVPARELRGVVPVVEVAAKRLFGSGAGAWLAALIGLVILASLSAYMLIGPRVYFAMARDGLFLRFAARVHPRFGTPALSIVAQGVCAVVMILSGTFGQLLKYIGFALGIFPLLTVAGLLVLRRREPGRVRPFRVWGYPLVPLLYLVAMGWILAVSLANDPGPALVALATVAAGIPVYWLAFARK
jgi:APA family basic amino acid/polyamine antiporter